MIRVFLLDDLRRGVAALLDGEDDIEVIGEAGTAESAIARIDEPTETGTGNRLPVAVGHRSRGALPAAVTVGEPLNHAGSRRQSPRSAQPSSWDHGTTSAFTPGV